MRVTVFYVSETFCHYYSQRSVLNAAQLLKNQINQRQHNNTKPDFNTSVSAHTKKEPHGSHTCPHRRDIE